MSGFVNGEVEVDISAKLRKAMKLATDEHMEAAKKEDDYWFGFNEDWDINIYIEPADLVDEPDYVSVRAYPLINVGRKHKEIITSVYVQLIGDREE